MAQSETGRPLLAVSDLSVSYGHVNALRGVSLEVFPGEIVVLIGDNPAGNGPGNQRAPRGLRELRGKRYRGSSGGQERARGHLPGA